ncbi:hypothetical protein CAPN001_23920 [Capnocytophaga stomatis]|uniref:hypothetical protein n=1 Tax=Capnocytophaga stomatis TaxID=1848904 RepID=UPI001950B1F1|nr:hypothetical protein [Capnocytophaga stomatis]GIJ97823.1 hypothetical protein CAPN001_23920 [Capnocytophaga stomatis]
MDFRKIFRELYDKNANDKIYSSAPYHMTGFDDVGLRELEKCLYIEDNVKRLESIRKILNKKIRTNGYVPPRETEQIEDYGFSDFEDFIKYREENEKILIYGCWVWTSYKRELEICVYVENIYKKAKKIFEKDKYEAICYIIDEKYKYHTNVLDNKKDDYIFRYQYNQIIFDMLDYIIKELLKIEVLPASNLIQQSIKKTLSWNAQKNIIGTLFGLLYKVGAIQGTKTDLIRGLSAMFSNLSESTLKDNIDLKENENEAKIKYDTETEYLLGDFLAYLKDNINNK